jgi:hypothetical protein
MRFGDAFNLWKICLEIDFAKGFFVIRSDVDLSFAPALECKSPGGSENV